MLTIQECRDALAQMRAYIEKVAGWTMLEDEYNAETPEGEMLRDQYDDIDDYRSDIDDDRLLSDFADLQGLIGEARELIAGLPHDAPDAAPAAPQTPDEATKREVLAALENAEAFLIDCAPSARRDANLRDLRAAIAAAEGQEG